MALYSRFRGDGSGYDYFESSERFGLGDDLAVPVLRSIGELGVPSTEAGRLPRGKVRAAGRGPLARGHVMPLDRSSLSAASLGQDTGLTSYGGWFLAGIGVGVLGAVLYRRQKK